LAHSQQAFVSLGFVVVGHGRAGSISFGALAVNPQHKGSLSGKDFSEMSTFHQPASRTTTFLATSSTPNGQVLGRIATRAARTHSSGQDKADVHAFHSTPVGSLSSSRPTPRRVEAHGRKEDQKDLSPSQRTTRAACATRGRVVRQRHYPECAMSRTPYAGLLEDEGMGEGELCLPQA